jgi:SpoVK/Ycf46/Vps4 family AAA+-type ATPase
MAMDDDDTIASFEELSHLVTTELTLDDLIFEPETRHELDRLLCHFRLHADLRRRWSFDRRMRPSGMTCLFLGPPGTGKTEAAATIAKTAGMPLWRVNVAAVLSPYVGVTARHLAVILDGAEERGVAVLFDEADAFFARRSQKVESAAEMSHNQQVAFLLSRLERWSGLAFLTTNLTVIDEAFKRRFHAVVQFPVPGPTLRARMWRLALCAAPVAQDVDFERLARSELPPGAIQMAAYKAALDAMAAEAHAVGMRHLAVTLDEQLGLYGKV